MSVLCMLKRNSTVSARVWVETDRNACARAAPLTTDFTNKTRRNPGDILSMLHTHCCPVYLPRIYAIPFITMNCFARYRFPFRTSFDIILLSLERFFFHTGR